MRIGMVVDNEFVGDVRVENEAQKLKDAGHEVFVLCFNYSQRDFEDYHLGAKVIRVKANLKLVKKLRALTNTVFNYYPFYWASRIKKFVIENKIDVLHVHDLYMFGSAFIARKKLAWDIPVVGDLHENYVEGLKKYRFANTFPGKFLISIPKWEKTELEWINKTDYAVTVIEEAVERYHSLGLPRDKFSVVANYVNIDEFTKDLNLSEEKAVNKKITITYVGGFDVHRGLESVVKSVPFVVKDSKNIKFVFVGKGKNLNDLKTLAENLNVAEYIEFTGWQPPEKLPSYVQASDICLIPHLKTVHTDNTIPHKLFQYMLLKKPVVSSDCNPLKRIIEETGSGLIYKSDDHEDLAEKIITLLKDKNLFEKFGENGHKAVVEKYNWDATSKNLLELYKTIELKIGKK